MNVNSVYHAGPFSSATMQAFFPLQLKEKAWTKGYTSIPAAHGTLEWE